MQNVELIRRLKTLEDAGWDVKVYSLGYESELVMRYNRLTNSIFIKPTVEVEDDWREVAVVSYWLRMVLESRGYTPMLRPIERGFTCSLSKGKPNKHNATIFKLDVNGLYKRNRATELDALSATAEALAEDEIGGITRA